MKRLLVGLTALVAGLSLPVAGATADTASPPITLDSQTPYVIGHGLFSIQISFSAPDPAHDQIEVLGFPQVRTRTDFASAAKGKVNDRSGYFPTIPVNGFSGRIDIPVNQPAPAGSKLPTFWVNAGGGGVFPFQIQLTDGTGAKIGAPLTTFMVWAAGPQQTPLSAAVVVPVSSQVKLTPSGQPLAPSSAESGRLNQLAAALNNDSSVSLGVTSDPLTLSSLLAGAHAGSAADLQILASLQGAPQDGLVEVMPAPYSPVDVGTLEEAGLGADIGAQLSEGARVLKAAYGVGPSTGTWIVNGPLDGSTLLALAAQHVTRLIVPDGDLTPLKPYRYTFAQPTGLDYGTLHLSVLASDPELTGDFSTDEPPVLAANRLLADLAMIQTEQPSNPRVVAAVAPAGWQASPEFVQTLLAGLENNPLVRAVTPTTAFETRPAGFSRELSNPAGSSSPADQSLLKDAGGIQAARGQIDAISTVVPAQSPISAPLRLSLLVAESSIVTEAERSTILNSIKDTARRVTRGIALPPSGSVTLTASRGQLPITILAAPSLRARVELRLNSQRLIFQPFNPPGGSCVRPALDREICTLSLTAQNTTLKVPVQTRSSGVFPLDVSLYSPGGALPLAHDHDTVRSTAVSGVGVVLIVVALASLLLWWGRDLRHGRRARRLVPSPVAEPEEPDIVLSDDPLVHQFFTKPAPEYKPNGRRRIG